jgi:siroheme synthase (precorrin-2 oxidase/ferrochelatase)
LVIAISSGGSSPLLVRMLKARFEATIPAADGFRTRRRAPFFQPV